MNKILLIDDHSIFREGLKKVLRGKYPGLICGEAEDYSHTIEVIDKEDWNLIILDVGLPGVDGFEILHTLKKMKKHIPILILSMYPESQFAIRAIKSGASGYLNKGAISEELLDATESLMNGGKYISDSLSHLLLDHLSDDHELLPHEKLSYRELQILRYMSSGKTVSSIAKELCLSVKTVSTVRAHLLVKMKMKNNAELIRYGVMHNL